MQDDFAWIERETVELIHERMLAVAGGSAGILDSGKLDGALMRPQNAHHYNGPLTLYQIAAHYVVSIAQAHAFADANKRTAYNTGEFFLGRHGLMIDADQDEIVEITVQVAVGEVSEIELAEWIELRRVPLPALDD